MINTVLFEIEKQVIVSTGWSEKSGHIYSYNKIQDKGDYAELMSSFCGREELMFFDSFTTGDNTTVIRFIRV